MLFSFQVTTAFSHTGHKLVKLVRRRTGAAWKGGSAALAKKRITVRLLSIPESANGVGADAAGYVVDLPRGQLASAPATENSVFCVHTAFLSWITVG